MLSTHDLEKITAQAENSLFSHVTGNLYFFFCCCSDVKRYFKEPFNVVSACGSMSAILCTSVCAFL